MKMDSPTPFPQPWAVRDVAPPSVLPALGLALLAATQLFAWLLWLGIDVLHRASVLDQLLGVGLVMAGLGCQCLLASVLEKQWAELTYRPFVAWYPRWWGWVTASVFRMLPWALLTAAFAAPAAITGRTSNWPGFLLNSLPTTIAGLLLAGAHVFIDVGSITTQRPKGSLLPSLPEVSKSKEGVTLIHLSDLHVTAGRTTLEGAPSPDPRLEKLLAMHADRIAETDIVLITGDMTDAGISHEWSRFFDILGRTPGLLNHTVLVPGNHDVSVSGARKRDGDEDWLGRSLRLIRMMGAIRLTQASRSYCMSESGLVRVDAYLDAESSEMQRFVDSPPERVVQELRTAHGGSIRDITPEAEKQRFGYPARVWGKLFPMAVQCAKSEYIFVFDSNRPASTILTNALGELSASQLARAEQLSQALNTPINVVGLHHQISLPSQTLNPIDLIVDRALTLVDAGNVFEWLAKRSVVVFHGHRHFAHESIYKDGPVTIISSRSTTIGDPRQRLPPAARRFRIRSGQITECETLELTAADV